MNTLLSEQAEADASPETLAIYTEFRRLCGVPMVPLIYRHFATIPGALEWAWSLLGPVLRTGELQDLAWTMSPFRALDPVATFPAEALNILGVGAKELNELHVLLRAYNRSNPVNLLGLQCLALIAQEGNGAKNTYRAPVDRSLAWRPPEPVRDLLPMVDPVGIQGDLKVLMQLLNERGDVRRKSPIWPSLYRHFASRPPLLALSALVVLPAFARIDAAAETVKWEARQRAEILVGLIDISHSTPHPSGDHKQAIFRAIDLFTERLPELIVISALLAHTVPGYAAIQ